MIHRRVKGGTEINCYVKEKQSEFSETRGFGEETQNSLHEGEPRNALCNIDYTSEDGCPQTKLTPE